MIDYTTEILGPPTVSENLEQYAVKKNKKKKKKLKKEIKKLKKQIKSTNGKKSKKKLKKRLKKLEKEHEALKQLTLSVFNDQKSKSTKTWWQEAVITSAPKAFEMATAAIYKMPPRSQPIQGLPEAHKRS